MATADPIVLVETLNALLPQMPVLNADDARYVAMEANLVANANGINIQSNVHMQSRLKEWCLLESRSISYLV